MATMTSSGSRRTVVVLLVAAAVFCRQLDALEDLPTRLDQLYERGTKALALAARRHYVERLPIDDRRRRNWRKNRVRVWGKRTSSDDLDDDDVDNENGNKRSWRKNTVRVWGKRQGTPTADRRSWAGNTIRVWGKRSTDGLTPEHVVDVAAARYNAAPKRSIDSSEARVSRLNDGGRRLPTSLSTESDVDVGTLTGDRHLAVARSKRSPEYRHGGRWIVRRDVGRRPRWLAFRGPKRSWRTNVIRVWGKRAL